MAPMIAIAKIIPTTLHSHRARVREWSVICGTTPPAGAEVAAVSVRDVDTVSLMSGEMRRPPASNKRLIAAAHWDSRIRKAREIMRAFGYCT
ncbi:MAG: hypothetical protein Alpg2KO_21960 [Alphaproteobacteria bacterium]